MKVQYYGDRAAASAPLGGVSPLADLCSFFFLGSFSTHSKDCLMANLPLTGDAPGFFSTRDPKSPGGGVSKIVSHVLDVTESCETKCQYIIKFSEVRM